VVHPLWCIRVSVRLVVRRAWCEVRGAKGEGGRAARPKRFGPARNRRPACLRFHTVHGGGPSAKPISRPG